MNRPYARDWKDISSDIQYSKELDRWWSKSKSMIYDELSAGHNGIIGLGKSLKEILNRRST